ncbi:uncharacterized protein [Bemisia tabaci]|uniref:uncharacterized protein isoform X1 n=1 Tax=Bemisia tabaci TaxID=7038 RepID=UPI003B28ACE1
MADCNLRFLLNTISWGVSLQWLQIVLAMQTEQQQLPYPVLQFQAGDIFYVKYFSLHWMVALDDTFYFKMSGNNDYTGEIVISKMATDELDDPNIFGIWPAPQEITPGVKLIGEVGIDLAWRMRGMTLHYDFFRCNCRHYIYYILYGTPTPFGKPWNLFNLPIDPLCPLAEILTKDSKVNRSGFRLKNGLNKRIKLPNNKYGTEIKASSRTMNSPQWLPGYFSGSSDYSGGSGSPNYDIGSPNYYSGSPYYYTANSEK